MPPSSALSHQPASAVPRKGGLGRGLAALIPTGPVGVPGDPASRLRPDGPGDAVTGQAAGAVYQEVPMAAIVPNPRQPRQVFDEDALAELAHSIREFGLLQPIVVRPLPAEPAIGHLPAEPVGTGRYELIMGERRWRAAQLAGLDCIPAIVRGAADDAMLRDALLENIHRVQLNPLEEAAAYQQLLEDFGV